VYHVVIRIFELAFLEYESPLLVSFTDFDGPRVWRLGPASTFDSSSDESSVSEECLLVVFDKSVFGFLVLQEVHLDIVSTQNFLVFVQ
jgi:hypothetical protein